MDGKARRAAGSAHDGAAARCRRYLTEALLVTCISAGYLGAAISLSGVGFDRLMASIGIGCADDHAARLKYDPCLSP